MSDFLLLTSARLMELRKRTGLMIGVGLLTIGIILLIDGITEILHATNPSMHPYVGGELRFSRISSIASPIWSVAAVLVGATVGVSDFAAGTYRHLVITGKSKWTIYMTRISAGLAIVISFTLFAFALQSIVATTMTPTNSQNSSFSPGSIGPSFHTIIVFGSWLLLQAIMAFSLSLGLSSLIGSRSTTIAILFAFQIIGIPILSQVSIWGWVKDSIGGVVLNSMQPQIQGLQSIQSATGVEISQGFRFLIVLAWMVVPIFIGALVYSKRDA